MSRAGQPTAPDSIDLDAKRRQQVIDAAILDYVARPVVTYTPETSNVRTVTIQVVNREGRPRPAYYTLLVYVTAATHAAPGGSQTITISTGAIIATLTANRVFILATDAGGKVVLDLDAGAGVGTRYVSAVVQGEVEESFALTYT